MTKKKTQDSYVSKPKTDPSFVEAKSRMDEVYDDELTANLTVLWNLPKENYDDVELLDESEDHQTYLSRDQTGRTIERDYYDEELLSEEWDTADGGHVIRDFSHQTLFYFDPDGNRFDISFHENGAIASKGWQPKHGSGLSLSFKDDGTPEGIFEGTEDDGHYTALESQ